MTYVEPPNLWLVRISAILWFLLVVGCLLALPVMLDASWLLVAAAAVLAVPLGALGALLWRVFALQAGFFSTWLRATLACFLALCIAIAAPIYFVAIRTETDPALLPRAVLTDGDKTVVFQGMMHVGSERFYKQVVYDAEAALADGYVLYYEGVQPNPEGDAWFSETLAGGGDLSGNYKMLGELCGLRFQLDYFGLLDADRKIRPESHVTADVDTLQMKQEFERLMASDPGFAAGYRAQRATADTGDGGMGAVLDVLDSMTPGQKKLSGYVCRYMMSRTSRAEGAPGPLDKVILDFRNRKLVERILADPHDRIYITYGAKHLDGVLALLQEADPDWHVESVSWIRPLEAPEQLEAEL